MKATDPEVVNLQHLHWALQVSQAEINERGGYLDDVKIKIYQLINDANLQSHTLQTRVILPDAKLYVGKLDGDHVKMIARAWGNMFSALADGNFTMNQSESKSDPPVTFYLGAMTPSSRFFQSVLLHSDPIAQAAFALQQHFVRSGLKGEQVRRCPECSTIFIRERKPQVGKEQFCSPSCARKAANRAYFERQISAKQSASTARPVKKKSIKKR